ncbi:MAG: gamma-glutamylcyclotransferase [Cyanobacteriota bacterium]
MTESLVFVYGTLQRGQINHRRMGGARFCGNATMPGIVIHDLGPFPMAVERAGLVHGEVYAVDGVLLETLDRFEGVPRLYQREWRPLSDGRLVWVYLGRDRQVRHAPLLTEGRWPGMAPAPDGADPSRRRISGKPTRPAPNAGQGDVGG